MGGALDAIADHPRALVIDFAQVPLIDSSGPRSIALVSRQALRSGGKVILTDANPAVRRSLHAAGLCEPAVRYLPDIATFRAISDSRIFSGTN